MNRRDVLKLGTAFGMATSIPSFATPSEETAPILVADADPDSMGLADLINGGTDANGESALAEPAHSFVNYGEQVEPILQSAYAAYVQDYIEGQMTSEGNVVEASEDLIPDMLAINEEYHSNFTYISDELQYGVLEDIRPAQPMDDAHADRLMKVAGDCDDYALGLMIEYNQRLGIDFSAMSMVVVDPEPEVEGPLHAVLLVRTDKGDMIFNNDGQGGFAEDYKDQFDFLQAQGLTNKKAWQSVSVGEPGMQPEMQIIEEYTEEELAASNLGASGEIPLPRKRPDPGGMDF